MKTFVFDNNYNQSPLPQISSWYFLTDSSLTNAGKPFFIPDFAGEFEAIPVIAIRINRLGKSIAPKFAGRYYCEFATAIHFRAKDLMLTLVSRHLPADRATSFDRSLIMGEWLPVPSEDEIKVVMSKNGVPVGEFDSKRLTLSIKETVSEASRANTLKMGDLIIPGLSEGVGIAINDVLELSHNGTPTLAVHIK